MHGTRTLHVTDKRTVRERITAVDMARGRVAVAQRQGHTVVFREDDFKVITQLPLNDFKHEGVSSLCFSHSGDVLLLGSASGLLFRLRVEQAPTHPQPIALDRSCCQGEDLLLSPIKNIVRQASKDTFAVATGRLIYVLDADGVVLSMIGPLQEPVLQLAWVEGSTLVGITPYAINTWTQDGSQLGTVLRNLSPSPYRLFAACNSSRCLAVVCSSKEVQCWDLRSVLSSRSTALADPVRLSGYDSQVDCLEWDTHSRYLATSDGPDVTLWDLSEGGEQEGGPASIVCCGHEPSTRVVKLAFQPEGHLLATASDSSRVVLYDVEQCWSGGVVGPAADFSLDPPGDEVTVLRWLPSCRLLAGTASGQITVFQVQPPTAQQSLPQPPTAQSSPTQPSQVSGLRQVARSSTSCTEEQPAVRSEPAPQPSSLPDHACFAALSLEGQQAKLGPVRTSVPPFLPPPAHHPFLNADGQEGAPRHPPVAGGSSGRGPAARRSMRAGTTSPHAAHSMVGRAAGFPPQYMQYIQYSEPQGGQCSLQAAYDAPSQDVRREARGGAVDPSRRHPLPGSVLHGYHPQEGQGGKGEGCRGRGEEPPSPYPPQQQRRSVHGRDPERHGGGLMPPPVRVAKRGVDPLPVPASDAGEQHPLSSPAGVAAGGGQHVKGDTGGAHLGVTEGQGGEGGGRVKGRGASRGNQEALAPPSNPSRGLSSSLLQHMAAVRDLHPDSPAAQQAQQRQLGGWGVGQRGGVHGMSPWMVMVPGGGQAFPMAIGPMAGGSAASMQLPVGAAHAQAQAQAYMQYHYQAAMTQRMAQGGHSYSAMHFVPGSMAANPHLPPTYMAAGGGTGASNFSGAATGAAPVPPLAAAQWQAAMQGGALWRGEGTSSSGLGAYPGALSGYPAHPYPSAVGPQLTYLPAGVHGGITHGMPLPSLSGSLPSLEAPAAPTSRRSRQNGKQRQGSQPPHSPASVPRRGARQASLDPSGPDPSPSPCPDLGSGEGEEAATAGNRPGGAAVQSTPPGQGRGGSTPPAPLAEPSSLVAAPTTLARESCPDGGKVPSGVGDAPGAEEGGAESGPSPTAVAGGGALAGNSSGETPVGSAADVLSVHSAQRGSSDGVVSPRAGGTGAGSSCSTSGTPFALGRRGGSSTPQQPEQRRVPPAPLRQSKSGGWEGRKWEGASTTPDSPGSPTECVSTVYVGNLLGGVDEYALGCTFMHFGPVLHAQVIRDKASSESKGFGFVTFAHPAYATLAMQQLDQQALFGPFGGMKIKVAPSRQRATGEPVALQAQRALSQHLR